MTASLSTPGSSVMGRSAWLEPWLAALPAPSGPLETVQVRGRRALREQPLPSSRQEDWRFTDLSLLQQLQQASGAGDAAPATAALPAPAPGVLRLVLDGHSDPLAGVSLPEGLEALNPVEIGQGLGHTLAATGCEQHWPVELNHAAAGMLLALRVTARHSVRLDLVSAAGVGLLPLRLLLVLEEKAELEVNQLLLAPGPGAISLVLEAHLARSARLQHALVALGHPEAALLGHLAMEQEPESSASLTAVSAGWGLARLEPRVLQVDGQAVTMCASTVRRGSSISCTRWWPPARAAACSTVPCACPATLSAPTPPSSAAACCSPIGPASTPSPSWRSWPMTCAVPMGQP